MDKGVSVCVRACMCACVDMWCVRTFSYICMCICGVVYVMLEMTLDSGFHIQAIEFCRMHQGRLYASTASLLWH